MFLIPPSTLFAIGSMYNNHNFKFVNNSGETINISVKSTSGNWFNRAYISKHNKNVLSTSERIPPYSSSQTIIIQNGKKKFYSLPQSEGTIILNKTGPVPGECVYRYSYKTTRSILSIYKKHSVIFQKPACSGSLNTNQLSVISEEIKAMSRDILHNKAIGLLPLQPTKQPRMIAQNDCGETDVSNCIILSPDPVDLTNNKSSLWQSLSLQAEINYREPLNFEQFIGTHNAAISPNYTDHNSRLNLNNIDPNQILTFTEMLNSGIRHLELDIASNGKEIIICHDHVSSTILPVLCQSNSPLTGGNPKKRYPLVEIKEWIEKNKDALIIIQLDINRPIDKNLDSLYKDLKTLQKYIFTPKMAQDIFGTGNNIFPGDKISASDIINKYNKNIFIVANAIPYLEGSPYIFTNRRWKAIMVQQASKIDIIRPIQKKYDAVQTIFKDTSLHRGLFRVYSDRTAIGFLEEKPSSRTLSYIYTAKNLRQLMHYPINIFAVDMWGFTCNSSQCRTHPSDPRFHAMLWSWDTGYPITRGAGKLAHISATTHRFQNKKIEENKTYEILCVHQPSIAMRSPIGDLQWFTVSKKISKMEIADLNTTIKTFETLCASSGGTFAAPVTSYWMNDVVDHLVKKSGRDILINYQYINNKWVPNSNNSLIKYRDRL